MAGGEQDREEQDRGEQAFSGVQGRFSDFSLEFSSLRFRIQGLGVEHWGRV